MNLKKRNSKLALSKSSWIIFLNCILCVAFIGYASLSRQIKVNGTANVPRTAWNIQFNNIRVFGGSVTASTPTISNKTSIRLNEIELKQPNDYYKFLVDVENKGTLDAKIKTITLPSVSGNLEFSATYKDGTPIRVNDSLKKGETKTLLVILKYKDSVATSTVTSNLTYTINYGQADGEVNYPTTEYTVNDFINITNGPNTESYATNSIQSEMYAFAHPATTQFSTNVDYRYIGKSPNNYIKFNNETWRIIGVFPTDNGSGTIQNRIKIMRDASLGNIAWDANDVNDWTNATLQKLLNSGDYYNRANTYASNGLNATAKSQIALAKYYLGGFSTYENLGGADYYNFERGTTVYSRQATSWNGLVGLMYPSDYIYTYASGVDDTCFTDGYSCDTGTKTNGWMFNSTATWTLAPDSSDAAYAFYVGSAGYVDGSATVSYVRGVRPVVYLKSDIKLSGTGTSTDPYVIK